MDATPWLLEAIFLLSSSLTILGRAFQVAPLLAFLYLVFIFAYAVGCFKLRQPDPIMFQSPLSIFNLFIFITLQLSRITNAQDAIPTTTTSHAGTPTSFRPIFTVPSSADVGTYISPAYSSCFGPFHGLQDVFRKQNTLSPLPFRLIHCSGLCLKRNNADFEFW